MTALQSGHPPTLAASRPPTAMPPGFRALIGAQFLSALAEAGSKPWLMMAMNALKVMGVLALSAVMRVSDGPIRWVLALFGLLVAAVLLLLMRLWRLQPAVAQALPGPMLRRSA